MTMNYPEMHLPDAAPGDPDLNADFDVADSRPRGFRITLSLESILWIALIAFALVIRLPELDVIPLNARESAEAMAAFHALRPDFGALSGAAAPVSRHPLMFTANVLAMNLGGTGNVAARFPTLAVGLALVCTPLLFRRWVGAPLALIAGALLAFSPVLLLASRSMGGAVWSAALALLCVYGFARYAETRRLWLAILGAVSGVLLLIAAEPAGLLTAAGVAVGILFALSATEERSPFAVIGEALLENLPRGPILAAVLLALLLVGTSFMLYPPAAQSIGASLETGLAGITQRPEATPALLPLLLAVVYEPVLVVFGLIGAFFVVTADARELSRERLLVYRGLLGWLVASLAWSLVYAGAAPAHTLWLTLPLAGLSAITLEKALSPVRDPFWIVPWWGVWLHALATLAIFMLAAINLITVGQGVLGVAPSFTPALQSEDSKRLILVGLAVALGVITFFLVGSLWGSKAAWRGLGLGTFFALSLFSLSAGWNAALSRPLDPRELWNQRPPSDHLTLIDKTLREASRRATGTPEDIDLVVLVPRGTPDFTYSPLAWSLRHFTNLRFVDSLGDPRDTRAPALIVPLTDTDPPLEGDYVGQDLATYAAWDASTVTYWDFIPWLYDRTARILPSNEGRVVIWLRADVYGVPGAEPPPETIR